MFGFAWMFWLLPFLFFLAFTRCRRRGAWAYADERQDYVDSLERRLADLEERLDFTERLLARRNQEAPGPV